MKIQTRITSLIFLTVLLVLVGIFFLWQTSRTQEGIMLVEGKIDKKFALDKVLETESLRAFASDTASWSDLARFVSTGNKKWAHDNLETALPANKVHALWVYRRDWSPVYSITTLKDTGLTNMPLARGEMKSVMTRSPFPHFFIRTPHGIMEVQGAPIQADAAGGEMTAPAGYLFAGRLWSQEFLQAKSYLVGGELRLLLSGGENGSEEKIGRGIIFFTKPLPGWDGMPVMWLSFRSEDPLVVRVTSASMQAFILSGVFSLTILTIISIIAISLLRWVSSPLKKISLALDTGEISQMRRILDDGSEVGHIADYILKTWEQKSQLENEVLTRKMAEEKLEEAISHIERAKKQWEDTFDNISDPIFIHDDEFRVIRANKAYARAAGMAFQDIIGKPYHEVFPVIREPLKGCLMSTTEQKESVEEFAFEGRTYRIRYFPTVDLSGEFKYSVHIMEDITERKALEPEEHFED